MRAGIAGIGGAALAAAPIMAAGAAVRYGVGQAVQGAQFNNQVFGMLENNFRFQNSSSRTGHGFSRQEGLSVSNMLQDMGAGDMHTNAQELRRVMGGTVQMGLMKTVQDVKAFKDKFKKTVGALKEIAETMNTTLEGAMPFFQAARQSGFWTPADIMKNARGTRATAQASGMSVAQVQQMQMQGANMARSVGAYGATGARGMSASLQFMGGAVRSGVVGERELAEATGGLTGSAAIGSASGTLQTAATRFASGRLGRWMLASMGSHGFKQLDEGLLGKFTSGQLSIGQIGSMARKNISKQGAFNFVNNERDLRGDLLQRGPETMLGLMKGVLGEHLHGTSSKSRLVTRRLMGRWFGLHGRQADMYAKMARESEEIRRGNQSRASTDADATSRQQEEILNHSWEGAKRKASKWLDENTKFIRKFGAELSTSISESWEKFTDKFWGRTPAHRKLRGISGSVMKSLQRSIMGDSKEFERAFGNPTEMRKMFGVLARHRCQGTRWRR
jgi:hypothetical protein